LPELELNSLKQLVSVFCWANLRWLPLARFLYASQWYVAVTTVTVLMKDSLLALAQAGLTQSRLGAVDILSSRVCWS